MKLVVDTLAVERGARRVISNLSFTVGSGEVLLLTGANGAGKTTLLRTLAGLARPAAGTVQLEGGDPELTVAEHVQFIGHLNAVKPALTVAENLSFWGQYFSAANPAAVNTALTRFNLADLAAIPAGYLSAGQKRRLALARLLVARRPVWLLDEPSVSLDSASTDILASIANAHAASGGIVIAATHLPLGFDNASELALDTAARRAA